MTHLILHIGPGKTASTSIQGVFSAAAPRLRSVGVLFPDAGRLLDDPREFSVPRHPSSSFRVRGPRNDHKLFAWSLRHFPETFELLWADLCCEAEHVGATTVFLSGEAFSELPAAEVRRLASVVESSFEQTTIVYYFRNTFDRAVSAYVQDIRVGAHHLTLTQYLRDDDTTLPNEQAIVERWSEAMPWADVVVKPWDVLATHNTLLADLLKTIGLDSDSFDRGSEVMDSWKNASIPASAVRMQRLANRLQSRCPASGVPGRVVERVRVAIDQAGRRSAAIERLNGLLTRRPLASDKHARIAMSRVRSWYPEMVTTHVPRDHRHLYELRLDEK